VRLGNAPLTVGLAHLCSGISPSFVLSDANDMIDFRFSCFEYRGGGVLRGGEATLVGRCLPVSIRRDFDPELLFESEDDFRCGFGRTQPWGLMVTVSADALFDLVCFRFSCEEEVLERFLLCVCLWAGTREREECESRWDSCEKVWIASIREAFERLRSAW
jgi:hypothetical protein